MSYLPMAAAALALQEMEMPSEGAPAAAGTAGTLLALVVAAFFIVVFWKIFTKAGEPGWASIIPIYNLIVYIKIAGKPLWWIILLFIPIVNLVVAILLVVALAERFGKGVGFAIGMLLLGFIFYPILAFGSATYQG